jgi:uncharacterized protein YpiB (UPF0302 family)
MKWGVRRYQNKDGTRTTLGKKRYRKGGDLYSDSSKAKKSENGNETPKGAIKNAPRRLAEGIVRGVKQKLAEKMPYFLNDEELQRYTDRQRAENTYLNSRADKRQAKQRGKQEGYGMTLLKTVVNKAAGTVVDKTVNKAMDRALETRDERTLRELTTKNNVYNTLNNLSKSRTAAEVSKDESDNIKDQRELITNRQRANYLANKIRESKKYDPRKPAYQLELNQLNKDAIRTSKELLARTERLKETRDFINKQGKTKGVSDTTDNNNGNNGGGSKKDRKRSKKKGKKK